jgi:hypothetical protein
MSGFLGEAGFQAGMTMFVVSDTRFDGTLASNRACIVAYVPPGSPQETHGQAVMVKQLCGSSPLSMLLLPWVQLAVIPELSVVVVPLTHVDPLCTKPVARNSGGEAEG